MKKLTTFLFISTLFISCATSNKINSENEENLLTDATYGYTEKNPIKVGGGENGPLNEREYLNALTGPNGEKVVYERGGSCCTFRTKNSPFGAGMLDIYKVTYEGKNDTVNLYLNMYDKSKLKAPAGFKMEMNE